MTMGDWCAAPQVELTKDQSEGATSEKKRKTQGLQKLQGLQGLQGLR
jgi:hypothetical protein